MQLENYIPQSKNIYDLNSSYMFKNIKSLNTVKVVDLLIDETMEMLSIRVYGSSKYWEALSLYNDIIDPFYPEAQVRAVRIPSKLDLDNFLNKSRLDNENNNG